MIGRAWIMLPIAVLVVGCSPLFSPVVRIDAGISPRMTPDEVEAVALRQIQTMERVAGVVAKPARVLSLTATTSAGVGQLEPKAGTGPPSPGVQWLVKAEGTFTTNRLPPGATPIVETFGFFVIADADGSIVSFGFGEP